MKMNDKNRKMKTLGSWGILILEFYPMQEPGNQFSEVPLGELNRCSNIVKNPYSGIGMVARKTEKVLQKVLVFISVLVFPQEILQT